MATWSEKVWEDGELITAEGLNHAEHQIAIHEGEIAIHEEEIAEYYNRFQRDEESIKSVGQKVDILYKLTQGQVWDEQLDNAKAYEKSVPAGAYAVGPIAISGKTIVLNQLINPQTSSVERTGITFTSDVDNGTITASGTATATATINVSRYGTAYSFKNGHRYMLVGCPVGGSSDTFYLHVTANTAFPVGYRLNDVGSGRIATAQGDEEAATSAIVIEIKTGTTVNNLMFSPRLYDLTLMFGADIADTISTPEEAYALGVPHDFVTYNTGELKSAVVDSVQFLYSVGTIIRDSLDIPSEVRSLPMYGCGISDFANGIIYAPDDSTWTFRQRVYTVDMGTLVWEKSNDYPGLFYAPISDARSQTPLMCAEYAYYGVTSLPDAASLGSGWMTSYSEGGGVRIFDTAYASYTAQQFKTAMAGKMLYYVKQAVTSTPITDIMPPYDLMFTEPNMDVQKSMRFHQDGGTKLPIPNSLSYFIKLSEAI